MAMSGNLSDLPIAVALRRFGYGGSVRDFRAWARDPRAALIEELARPLPGTAPALANAQAALFAVENDIRVTARRVTVAALANAPPPEPNILTFPPPSGPFPIDVIRAAMEWGAEQVRTTDAPFQERLVRFWTQHFVVSRAARFARGTAAAFEFDVIRPRLHGRFADMLEAAVLHVAMLEYLTNSTSIGRNSPRGRRMGGGGDVNENLAREVLELHTLGPDGGYTQADVNAFARALSGWTFARASQASRSLVPGTIFDPAMHEPGPKTVLGQVFAHDGPEQAKAVLAMLAAHPSTARNLARRMALHFVGERAPKSLVERIATRFLDTQGDLPALYRALVDAPEAWAHPPAKLRPPLEFFHAATRLLDQALPDRWFTDSLTALGQPALSPPSPKGWDEGDDAWVTSDGIKSRLDLCVAMAQRWGRVADPRRVAEEAMGPALSTETRRLIAQAATPEQGLALLLMSPEVQRR